MSKISRGLLKAGAPLLAWGMLEAGCDAPAPIYLPEQPPPIEATPADMAAERPPQDAALDLIEVEAAELEWVQIGAGRFEMGAADGREDERPVHTVHVPTFQMSKTEVTVGHYRECVDAGACDAPRNDMRCNWLERGRENHPINCVTYPQARAFATWFGARLPSEAEWEYAARSQGQDRVYPWGDDPGDCVRAVVNNRVPGCGRNSTAPVCSLPLGNTDQGLCDMAGNVNEFVEDRYGPYDKAPTDGSARTESAERHVERGGGFQTSNEQHWRSTYRRARDDDNYWATLGFRLARTVD